MQMLVGLSVGVSVSTLFFFQHMQLIELIKVTGGLGKVIEASGKVIEDS